MGPGFGEETITQESIETNDMQKLNFSICMTATIHLYILRELHFSVGGLNVFSMLNLTNSFQYTNTRQITVNKNAKEKKLKGKCKIHKQN